MEIDEQTIMQDSYTTAKRQKRLSAKLLKLQRKPTAVSHFIYL